MAAVLGQDPGHELMALYAEALRDLGRFLGERRALDVVAEAGGSAERLASMLAAGMRFYDDRGFWKRAQIDAGELLPPGDEEREIRASAVHACELIAARLDLPPRVLDTALWNKGQAPRYKSVPRHRTRTVYY